MQPDFAGDQVDLLIVVQLQIDDAVLAEAGHGMPGLGVQSDQPVAGRDVQDSLFLAIGPIGQAMAGKLPRRICAALAFVLAVHPEHFARGRIQSDHGAARSRRWYRALPCTISGVAFELIFRPRAERFRLEAPGDFEFVEIVRVDLVERRVARAAEVAAVGGPFPVFRAGLRVQPGYSPGSE